MKRPQFLASLAALCAAPFVSLSKEDKPTSMKGKITYAGKVIEPYIIRESYRVPNQDASSVNFDFVEKSIEDRSLQRIMLAIKNSPHLKRAKILNPDGSVEFHYLLKLLPNA